MPRRNPDRIVPATADQLLDSHPGINVMRDQFGTIDVFPSLGAPEPFIGFTALLHMSYFAGQRPGSALRVVSRRHEEHADTILKIPTFGSLSDMVVTVRGKTDPNNVIAMATEGVELLDDLRNLPDDERRRYMAIPDGNQKAYDGLAFPEPEITAETIDDIVGVQLVYGAFQVAKRILLLG